MSNYFEKYQLRRLRSSYFSVIVSSTVVLFMLGILGITGMKYKQGVRYFKEQITMTVFLKDSLAPHQIENMKKSLAKKPAVKEIVFVSREQAVNSYSKILGEDFLKILGTNPLKNAFDVRFEKSFVNTQKIALFKKELQENAFVFDVVYDKNLVPLLNKNLQKIGFWASIFLVFFGLIAMVLISASIRLSIYSKRFIINTMQMVGATKKFIRRPFLIKSIQLGTLSAFVANVLFLLCLYYLDRKIPYLDFFNDKKFLFLICLNMFITGIFISWISTFFAVQKFLKLKSHQLYY